MEPDVSSTKPKSLSSTSCYDFGECMFYADIGELHSKITDKHIHIEKKVSEVFQCLARSPNEVVTRDEIFDQVWPHMTVSDDSLNRCISVLRRIFREFDHGLSITTHPKVGFHLNVEHLALAPMSNQSKTNGQSNGINENQAFDSEQIPYLGQGEAKQESLKPFKLLIYSMCCTVGVFILVSYTLSRTTYSAQDNSALFRLIIMNFTLDKPLTGQYNGLQALVLNKLSNHPHHTVIASEEINQFPKQSPLSLSEQFNARFALTGNIKSLDNRDVFQWQLIDGKTGDLVASEMLNLKLNSLAVNSQIITADITTALGNLLYADKPQQHLAYIIESADYLFDASNNWQMHQPIITLVAKAIVEVDEHSVTALKSLSRFLINAMWPLKYKSLPYTNLATRILIKAQQLAPQDIEIYQLLMKTHLLRYQWQDALNVVKVAQQKLNLQPEATQALFQELQVSTLLFSKQLINFYQTQADDNPLASSAYLRLTQLYLMRNDHLNAYQAQNNIMALEAADQMNGIALGQLNIKYGNFSRGNDFIWLTYQHLGVPEQYKQAILSLYNDVPLAKAEFDYFIKEIELAVKQQQILPIAALFLYGSLGINDNFFPLAQSLLQNYQFHLLSLINTQTSTLVADERFKDLVSTIKLPGYWAQSQSSTICPINALANCL
ncbi:winged helix-turn-helix domain-containing protein [Colwellia sp. MEBiC06753]